MKTDPQNARSGSNAMNRFDLTKRLVSKLKADEAVIGGIGNSNFDLWAAGQRPQNFYMLGSMGLACPIALGVALAQPKRTIFAIEGDGSLLMQLGCLATIAMINPPNLHIIIMDNGGYQITGSQPAATKYDTDLVAMARGAGLKNSQWVDDETAFEAFVDAALRSKEPTLAGAKIDMKAAVATTERNPFRIRDNFTRGIAPDS
jgi:thiamine pyrophosphate-dependent acetolactate synthase large subunit-like protein